MSKETKAETVEARLAQILVEVEYSFSEVVRMLANAAARLSEENVSVRQHWPEIPEIGRDAVEVTIRSADFRRDAVALYHCADRLTT